MSVVTRFAPSPTGYLHVGGARTALFSWLYAKQQAGEFILRIEDTDQERSTQASVDAILDGMRWLGLIHDLGPYYQTERMQHYQDCIQELLDSGHAYRCYCSKERLESLRETQMANKEKPRYDGCCRDLKEAQAGNYVIRFKNPETGTVVWDDLVKGKIEIANAELDDLIIARSGGSPTYNLTVVVDDWLMKVTHVIRGDDHVNNTPRQINLLKALGVPVPAYAHVPMILGEDGKRLSKRHGAVSVMAYRELGYLPQALLNYLVRLGWSHGDQEVFSIDEMVQHFNLQSISRSPAAFNTDKLNWLNQHYLKSLPYAELETELQWHYANGQVDLTNGPALQQLIPLMAERVNTLVELVAQTQYFYQDVVELDATAAKKHLRPVALEPMQYLYQQLQQLSEWKADAIHQAIQNTVETLEVGMGKIGMPLRVAITGSSMSPAIDITAELIGHDRCLARLQQAIQFIESRAKAE